MQEYEDNLKKTAAGRMDPVETDILEGIVESVIFRNESNGFTVFAIDAQEPVIAVDRKSVV